MYVCVTLGAIYKGRETCIVVLILFMGTHPIKTFIHTQYI